MFHSAKCVLKMLVVIDKQQIKFSGRAKYRSKNRHDFSEGANYRSRIHGESSRDANYRSIKALESKQ